MDLAEIMRCLHEADADELRPELCNGRYLAATSVDEETTRAATSLYEAIDHVVDALLDASGYDGPEELLAEFDPDLTEVDAHGAMVSPEELRSPKLKVFAALLLGELGPMDIVTSDHADDVYLGQLLGEFPGSHFAILASAAPPNQDVAVGVLQLP